MNFRPPAALGALALALGSVAASAETPPPAGVLGLSASATVEVTRDILSITLGATRDGTDAQTVQSQLKTALDAALAEAKKSARPGQVDVSTGNFALFPRYAPKGGAITGWQGSADLVIEGRDLAGIAALAGRLSTVTVKNVAFRLSREAAQKVETDVSAEAIARFRAKAADYAKQFGYAGVAIREVTVNTQDGESRPMPMIRMQAQSMSASSDPLPVEPGRATVTASVNGTVQMK